MTHLAALVSRAVAGLVFVQLDVSTIMSAPPQALAPAAPLNQQTLNEAFNNGNSKLMIGEFQEALNAFNRAAELAPGNEDVYLSRGIALEKLLKWDDAIADYRRSNELHKKNHLFAKVCDIIITALLNLSYKQTKFLTRTIGTCLATSATQKRGWVFGKRP